MAAQLTVTQKESIIKGALALLTEVYVHLPLKKAMHAINPVQRLRLLERRADQLADREFHNEMLSIFLRLRDLHTNYILPEPLNRTTAFLPFRLEEYHENDDRKYLVTLTNTALVADRRFVPGVIATHWNGVPIGQAVDLNADREAGSNPAARHACGLASLTMRWLGMSLPPDEDWVDITYLERDNPEVPLTTRFEWQVFEQSPEELGVAVAAKKPNTSACIGLDLRREVQRQVGVQVFRASRLERRMNIRGKQHTLETTPEFTDVFPRVGDVVTADGTFGYIRIATFDVENDQRFIDEFLRLVGQLVPNGLIIDVRGNGGGLIMAGERLLQCLTPHRIEPEKLHFINTETTLALTQHTAFAAWQKSIEQAIEISGEFSQGFPLLPHDAYNDIGQQYQGPVVLLTDALCYSTTDIFAAGFQDHNIGKILGVAEFTGAGGANVWDYGLVRQLVPAPAKRQFVPIPRKADFRVAIRRTTRVKDRAGVPLEDLGVAPDLVHRTTLDDVLHGHVDLIARAITLLKEMGTQSLVIKDVNRKSGTMTVSSSGVDRIDVYLDGRPQLSEIALKSPADTNVPFQTPVNPGPFRIDVNGYRNGVLVVSSRQNV